MSTTETLDMSDLNSQIELAKTFSELADIAIASLKARLNLGGSNKAVIVCGPITTGGLGSPEKNLKVIELTNKYLQELGFIVFDHVLFENKLFRLKEEWLETKAIKTYCTPILEDFYLPIYESGLIGQAYFLPGWDSSFGAKWERGIFSGLKIPIDDLRSATIHKIVSIAEGEIYV